MCLKSDIESFDTIMYFDCECKKWLGCFFTFLPQWGKKRSSWGKKRPTSKSCILQDFEAVKH